MAYTPQGEYEKRFCDLIQSLSSAMQPWEVWTELIAAMACAIANSVTDPALDVYKKREEEYLKAVRTLGSADAAAEAFAIVTEALDANPEQDFLGKLYMVLGLGDHWKGQVFTPYNLSALNAMVTIENVPEQVAERGWIAVNDCAVGGGAMLIGAANEIRKQGVNYQNHVLFVGQDISRTTGMSAYIQLSLLGCPGYIVIADSLTNPITGDPLLPCPKEGQEYWFTPMYYSDVWYERRQVRRMDLATMALLDGKRGNLNGAAGA